MTVPADLPGAGYDTTPSVYETVITIGDLEIWTQAQPGEYEGDTWALECIRAASLVVREAGDLAWSVNNVPDRAALIAKMLAADLYQNPKGLKTDTTGPISETRIDAAVRQMRLSEEEKTLLATLAEKPDPNAPRGGLWVQPLGTGAEGLIEDFYVTDQSGSDWMIPWARIGDNLYPEL